MMIIGVDYHPSFQTIAFLIEEAGECGEQKLNHSDGQAEKFSRDLKQRGISVRVGLEATGYSRWFERLLAELGFELWIGDPAEMQRRPWNESLSCMPWRRKSGDVAAKSGARSAACIAGHCWNRSSNGWRRRWGSCREDRIQS